MAKRSTTTRNQVIEMKKAEIREERLIREGEFKDPMEGIVDDVQATPVKDDAVLEEIEEEVPEPVKPVPKALTPTDEAALIEELTKALKIPKTKDSIMVFSMYTIGDFNRRYFLLDVDGTAYRKAWNIFKERTGTTDQVKFLEMVYQILNTDMPRLHRAVDWVPLN